MTLHLVASNPDVPKASRSERVRRKLVFAEAELKRLAPYASGAQEADLIARLRRTLRAGVDLLMSREQAS